MERIRIRVRPGAAASGGVVVAIVAFVFAACVPDAVRWDGEPRLTSVVATGARLSLEPGDGPRFSPPWVPLKTPGGMPICAASLVTVRARGDTAYAAWWAPRSDSSALLVVARSDDRGGVWREPAVADSTDRGRTGCARPVPFVAADSVNGYVHVVYFLVAPEGPGVFVTHAMEGGTMFHSPVPVVYGERPSAAAVASHGDIVAVAYEDPNASVPQVWLALSRAAGHIFEQRTSVSSANTFAARPAVALHENRIAVGWLETARGGGVGSFVLRTGTMHW